MEKTKEELHSSIRIHEKGNLREWGKKSGVCERDLEALLVGVPDPEEYRKGEIEILQNIGIPVIAASRGGSVFYPEWTELEEEFREDAEVQSYLRELRERGLAQVLTAEQEAELAGDSREEKRLVEGNLLRVVSIVWQYRGQELPPRELICEGNQALVDAVRSWDPEKDCPITLYLIYYIRRGICAALAWPEKVEPRSDIMETLREQMEEAPDPEAIYRRQNSRLPIIGENGILYRLKMKVVEYRDLMTPRELEVICLRMGLTDGHNHTPEEVAEQFGITVERLHQIENKFLRRYRQIRKRRRIEDFYS